MDEYKASCPKEVEEFRREVTGLIGRFLQSLEDQYKAEVTVGERTADQSSNPSLRFLKPGSSRFSFVVCERGSEKEGILLS